MFPNKIRICLNNISKSDNYIKHETHRKNRRVHTNKMNHSKRGAGNPIMNVIFGTILIVAAAIPVTQEVIDAANLTGTTSVVVGLIPLFLGLAGLALAASLVA